MTQPTASYHWRTMVGQQSQGPISPGSAQSRWSSRECKTFL